MLAAILTLQQNGAESQYQLSDFWQKVLLALLAAVLGFVASFILDRRKAKREPLKRLAYDISIRSGISAIPQDLRNKVQVLYNSEIVTHSLYDVECLLRNTGNRVIRNQFVRYSFGAGTYILDVILDDTPEIGMEEVESDGGGAQRRYVLKHLEREQLAKVRFIVSCPSQPELELHPFNEEGDVEVVRGSVARVAEDVEHLRQLTVVLIAYWFLASVVGGLTQILYGIGAIVNAVFGLVFFALAAPHLLPAGRVVRDLVHRALSSEDRASGIQVTGGIYGTRVEAVSGESRLLVSESQEQATGAEQNQA